MNRQIVEGNLVSPASVVTGKNGRDILNFVVACNEGKDSNGKDIVEYIPVSAYGKAGFADKLKDYLGKGAAVAVIGKLVYSKNEKDNAVYTNPRVEAQGLRNIRLVGGKAATPAAEAAGSEVPAHVAEQAAESAAAASEVSSGLPAPSTDSFDDDIPF